MSSLADFDLFSGMTTERLGALEKRCKRRSYEENDLVIDYDEATTDVWFLLSGLIRVLFHTPNGKEFIFGELSGGEFFGELSALDGNGRSAHVTALQSSQLLVMPAAVFVDVVTENPEIGRQVMQLLVTRVRHLSIKLAEHAYLSAKQRLYAEILRMSRPRADDPGTRVISPPPIHRDLGARIGSRRESVSREIRALEKSGIITQTRGALVVHEPETLQQRLAQDLTE